MSAEFPIGWFQGIPESSPREIRPPWKGWQKPSLGLCRTHPTTPPSVAALAKWPPDLRLPRTYPNWKQRLKPFSGPRCRPYRRVGKKPFTPERHPSDYEANLFL